MNITINSLKTLHKSQRMLEFKFTKIRVSLKNVTVNFKFTRIRVSSMNIIIDFKSIKTKISSKNNILQRYC